MTFLFISIPKIASASESYIDHLDYWKQQEALIQKQREEAERLERERLEKLRQQQSQPQIKERIIYKEVPSTPQPEPVKPKEYIKVQNKAKEIYTFSSQDGNIFHLNLEHDENGEQTNVSLLAQVREKDLISLARDNRDANGNKLTDPLEDDSPIAAEFRALNEKLNNLESKLTEEETTEETTEEKPTETTEETKKKKGGLLSGSTLLFIGVLAIAGAGAYYKKVLKPNQLVEDQETEDVYYDDYEEYDEEHDDEYEVNNL